MKNLFLKSEQGSVLMLFAVIFAVFIGTLLFSIDTSKMSGGYAKLQNSTDSSALATAQWIVQGRKNLQGQNAPDASNWRPDDAGIRGFALESLAQSFKLDQTYAQVDDMDVEVTLTETAEGLEVMVEACSTVGVNFTFFADGSNEKEVCTDSTARIEPGGLINKEIVFVFDAGTAMNVNSSQGKGFIKALLGNKISAGGVSLDPSHPSYIEGILSNYFISTDNMRDRNLLVGFVPVNALMNIAPYQDSFVNNVQGGNYGDLSQILGAYPVFDEDDFNNFIVPNGLRNFKFDTSYDITRYTKDGGLRGRLFEEFFPVYNVDEVLRPRGSGTAFSYYPADSTTNTSIFSQLHGIEFRHVREAVHARAEGKFLQPLTDDYDLIYDYFDNFNFTQHIYFHQAGQPLPQHIQREVNNLNPAVRNRYLNTDLYLGNVGRMTMSRFYNGFLWAYQILSEQSKNKWNAKSMFEQIRPSFFDRTNLPDTEDVTRRDKIVIVIATIHGDGNAAGDNYAAADSYTEFPDASSSSTLPHHPEKNIMTFDDNTVFSQPRKPADTSATYERLCGAMHDEGIDIYFYQLFDYPLINTEFEADMERCANGNPVLTNHNGLPVELDNLISSFVTDALVVRLIE